MSTNFVKKFHFFKNKNLDVQNASPKLDLIKMEIRGFTIKFSKI